MRVNFSCLPWLLLAWSSSQAATIHYVRTDGGNAIQCTGKADAAYPGKGTAQACAWKSLHYALPIDAPARIAGGDTVLIARGNYMIGWGAPGAAGGRCYSGGHYDCYLPPIPSGSSAVAKTRILGQGHDTGCKVAPKLWGTERVNQVLNLEGSSNVEVGCLEITDRSDCVEFHSNLAARCQRDVAPYGDWASVGLAASDSRNVWLHDLNIHGLANTGVHAGRLRDWTVERVAINANGWVGWNGDLGGDSANAGAIILRHVEIAWNGCGQHWQTGVPWACWAQEGGGYGDGLGTGRTGGHWLIEDSRIHHNTSDGLDLLYLDGGADTSVVVRRVYAVGNAGNQIKTQGTAIIENSVVVGHCAYFNGRYDMTSSDQCRAQGNALSIGLAPGQTVTVRHNTITGEGDCLILSVGGSAGSRLRILNNALLGQPDFLANARGLRGELSCGHWAEPDVAAVSLSGNLLWNLKPAPCPPGNVCGQHPKLRVMDLVGFDATPMAGSPLLDRAPALPGMTEDFHRQPRPAGFGADIGAIEKQP